MIEPTGGDSNTLWKTSRRRMLGMLMGLGVGNTVMCRALAEEATKKATVNTAMIQSAEWIAGIELSEVDRQQVAETMERALDEFKQLRTVDVGYSVAPSVVFLPEPQAADPQVRRNQADLTEWKHVTVSSDVDLAFLPVTELAALIRSRRVTSSRLTRLYLSRLETYDPLLHCVMTVTRELAMEQAVAADREIAAGRYRGPLHGIPYGAKDLVSVPGYKTTWGATPFKDQQLDEKATVIERLEQAGAVLVAKLSLGALAMGDRWYDQMTRNPWNPQQGSSGSSAGSCAAVAAGLVGFALGSETLGSIVSPARRCGATGLRPTFGRVSRHGCMALSWTMDKIGPITRSIEDCALVLDAIHGVDGFDYSVVDRQFTWPAKRELRELRVGYTESETPRRDRDDLQILEKTGVQLIPIKLPEFPHWPITIMLDSEAGTMFDPLTRAGITEGLNSWPGTFRKAQLIPATEYLRAARVRTLLMNEMRKMMQEVDMYMVDTVDNLAITNLTGHPAVVLPFGFDDVADQPRTPKATTLTGQLYGESELLWVAKAIQDATGFHLDRPPLEQFLQELDDCPEKGVQHE